MLFDAKQFGLNAVTGSDEEQEYLGLPGSARARPDGGPAARAPDRPEHPAPARKAEQPVSAHRALAAQRQELNKLVAAYARKKGTPHGVVHNELRRACGGPALDEATSEQVVARVEKIRAWFVGRR